VDNKARIRPDASSKKRASPNLRFGNTEPPGNDHEFHSSGEIMADQKAPQMHATLGLTGLTSNAMALIAPGAFLWLTFYLQATEGTTSPAMWFGIVLALLLCLATAVAYAEI
jgi:hypothetical protein